VPLSAIGPGVRPIGCVRRKPLAWAAAVSLQ
jgi:hypothetical protein